MDELATLVIGTPTKASVMVPSTYDTRGTREISSYNNTINRFQQRNGKTRLGSNLY